MKGTFFSKPLECGLRVEGESWRQGEPIAGTLVVKNHGAAAVPESFQVQLAKGRIKKVHQKVSGAFKILATSQAPATELAPGGEMSHEWKFESDRNVPITDNSESLFLLYGQVTEPEKMGHLQVTVKPAPVIEAFLSAFQSSCRFVVKGLKAGKKGVEAKLAPPDSQTFMMLDYMVVSFRFEGETLHVDYVFNVKDVRASSSAVEVKKKKKEFEQVLAPGEYRLSSGHFNTHRLDAAATEAVKQVEGKISF